MKASITILLFPCAALLSGCAGYNHTLFMTKSNVGLDFDTKPPTMEVTVSRKEAVIAPAFEGGQTPPVMASFKPHTGANGAFRNFFLGVDQTFAGGDAAVAMSSLYASEQAPPPEDRTKFDSTLKLQRPPKYKDWFRRLARPGVTRPFIFGTDTTLGLKVAWTGTGGQFPDTVKMGFNRKEYAWAPVSMRTNLSAEASEYHVKMPSFLATIDSNIASEEDGGGVSALQYFATGEAATLLAMQPVPRQAMVYRLDPAAPAKAQALQALKDPARLESRDRLDALLGKSLKPGTQLDGRAFPISETRAYADALAAKQGDTLRNIRRGGGENLAKLIQQLSAVTEP
jgi:hypothetical protein